MGICVRNRRYDSRKRRSVQGWHNGKGYIAMSITSVMVFNGASTKVEGREFGDCNIRLKDTTGSYPTSTAFYDHAS